jgi:hypothetical protein
MANQPCQFIESPEEGDECGETPTEPLAIGMTAPDPDEPGHAGTFQNANFSETHLPEVQRRMGQK